MGEREKNEKGRREGLIMLRFALGKSLKCVGLCSVFDATRKGLQTQLKPAAFLSPVSVPWVSLKLGSGVSSLIGAASIGYFRSKTAISRDEVAVLQRPR